MTYIGEYGDVISSALDVGGYNNAGTHLFNNFSLHAGEITAIYTSDDSSNEADGGNGVFTLYDVLCTSENGSTETIYRCRALQPMFGGGINNYMEVTPTVPDKVNDRSIGRSLKRGHQVLVGCIGGRRDAGIILGGIPHTSPVAIEGRPTKEEGVVTRLEIQGLQVEINNDGEFNLMFQGPKDDEGAIVDDSVGPTIINIDKQGIFTITTKDEEQSVTIDQTSSLIELKNKETTVTMDGGSGKISIVGDVVETGTGSLESHVCGESWKEIMEELIDEISQIIVPTGVGPSGTPQNAAKFSSIKQKLKTALSSKHKVEK